MTIYHEFSRRWNNSARAEIIANGWGTTTPAVATKHTKVQVMEATEAEYQAWLAARAEREKTLWDPWRKR